MFTESDVRKQTLIKFPHKGYPGISVAGFDAMTADVDSTVLGTSAIQHFRLYARARNLCWLHLSPLRRTEFTFPLANSLAYAGMVFAFAMAGTASRVPARGVVQRAHALRFLPSYRH